MAALIGLDHAMRVWIHLPHRWVSHSLGSVGGTFVVAWGGSPWVGLAELERSLNVGAISLLGDVGPDDILACAALLALRWNAILR